MKSSETMAAALQEMTTNTVIRYQKRVNGHVVIMEEYRSKKEILDFGSMWKYKA